MERVVDIQLGAVEHMLSENGIKLEVSQLAHKWISKAGYDPMFGARPIKRTIQRYVINELSKSILAGKVDKENPIRIDTDDTGLVFNN